MMLNKAYLQSHQVHRAQADFLQISVEIDLGSIYLRLAVSVNQNSMIGVTFKNED